MSDMPRAQVRVLLVDDQPIIRLGFIGLMATDPAFVVVGEAGNGVEAVRLATRLRPDVVLMDIRMPVLDGIEATRQICSDETLSATRVLILTTFEQDENVLRALKAGASGFLGKSVESEELLAGIRAVAAGESLLSPAATRTLISSYLRSGPTPGVDSFADLTDREREVVLLVATGLSNSQIADRLVISPLTAKTHVNRAMTKLGARDRAQLVILAYQGGLIHP